MKAILFLILLFFLAGTVHSQSNKYKYALSAEIGKSGLIYSLIFDNTLKDRKFGLRGGMGTNFGRYRSAIMGLVGAYRLFGKNGHFFETGIDLHYLSIENISDDQAGISTFVHPNYPTRTYYITANGGYRVHAGKILFRVGIAPGFTKDEFIPGGYLSFGFRF